MRHLRWILFTLRSLAGRRQRETDLDAELQFHLDAEADEAADSGLSPDDARRAARRHLGNIALTREETRGAWTWRWLEELAQDVRYAVLVLRRRPVFTVTALLSLALGLGANIAVFNLADNLMFKPLPVERPHELVRLGRPEDTLDAERYDTYERLKHHSRQLAGVIAMTRQFPGPGEIETDGTRQQAFVQMVSDDYFDVLGVRAWRGHLLQIPSPGEAREGRAVISHAYWQRQYSGDTAVLGSRASVNGADLFISGIAPPGFQGTDIDFPIDIWVPYEYVVPADSVARTRGRSVQVMARVPPGGTLASATAEAAAILERPVELRDGSIGFSRLRVDLALPVVLLAIVSALTLLVACANLANLITAGTVAREREIAVRHAVGASSGRLSRQVATETIVLVLAGTVLAAVVAPLVNAALLTFLPPSRAQAVTHLRFSFDGHAATFTAVLSLLTGLVLSLGPILSAVQQRPTLESRTGSTGSRRSTHTSRILVVAGISTCTVLLATSSVFIRTLQNLHAQNVGYVAERLLSADIEFPREYPTAQRDRAIEALRDRAALLPGVEIAAFSHSGQLSGFANEYPVAVPSVSTNRDEQTPWEERISPGFFATMGTRLVAGREFTDLDDEGSPDVAIVNGAFAARYFPGVDAVGRSFTRTWPEPRPLRVVGVVDDTKWLNLRDASPIMFYVPHRQHADAASARLVVRARGDLTLLAVQLEHAARTLDPGMQISNVVPFTDIVNRTLVVERLVAHVSTAFAVFGLVIACIGLYGILAFAVVRRTREIGLRIALGAGPGSVERMFLRETTWLLVAGLAVGLPAAYAAMRAASSLLFGLEPGDPATISTVAVVLAATGFAAAWVPARRAARIDPMQALRSE